MNATTEHYLTELNALASQLPGQDIPWLQRIREDGRQHLAERGFPTTRDEDWKYTDVKPIQKHTFRPTGKACVGMDHEDIEQFVFEDPSYHRLVFVNGYYTPELSRPRAFPGGVTGGSLAKALAERPDALEPYLGHYAEARAHGFTALNTAFLGDGAYIHLPPGTVVEHPIHLVFISTSMSEPVFSQPRNLIVVGDNSQASIIESYVSLGNSRYFTNTLTEVSLGKNAGIEHYKLQEESIQAYHIGTLQVHLDRDSRFTSHALSLGGRLVRNDINSVIDAEGAQCTLNGLYVANDRQHMDNHTRIDHVKPHSTSSEYYKGILQGRARGVFNGKVYVHPDAQKTDASQSNKNLLLSKEAEVDTKPELEIYADDVKCSHGATVGQLDENQIFYLRSRGIKEHSARVLLTYAFAQDIVERMPLASVRERVEERFKAHLPDADQIRAII